MEDKKLSSTKPATSSKPAPKAPSTGTKVVTKPASGPRPAFKPGQRKPHASNASNDKVAFEKRNFTSGDKTKKPTDSKNPRFQRNNKDRKFVSEYEEKIVNIARVTKVVKGGRRFSFSAFVVIGNKKGTVGYGHGKANEVPDAIKKAIKDAHNNLVEVPITKGTVPHEVTAKFLASKVLLKPAPKGKGLIASSRVRAVVELAGYTDIVSKTYGSRSAQNVVKSVVKALLNLRTAKQIAEVRDKDVKDLL
ncbi:30S ribosomal protein S5 [Mycoplasmopsis synoviae]|uniref:30S ribosomal protein S5 n=1 Tax=Mycoplasmopsis synoviae TaxID=2109 RepID=UPI000CA3C4E7|nr:SSU ribosomal protein S5p (S2e) [Mycoplasmopsis synoviae]AQU48174.1 SSU ribosomal protein S5p (S2e) [Mycoplasmopsis synoviae]AWL84389.1 30S ribosomal protein S5 [Mycoplasmopsis synoviae]QLE14106.1 30S ribosomal protein S5 [Mycoplasmopsis synoviae]UZF64254.1 30S ribosomal protein S5 [Mycoplasmopsis synoviae]